MKKNYILCIALLATKIILFAQIPKFEWAYSFGSISCPADYPRSTQVDASGNIYISSNNGGQLGTPGPIDFDPGAGQYLLTPNSSYGDLFIQKVDPNKNLLWVAQFGTNAGQTDGISCVDKNGNVYAIGKFIATVDFDPSSTIYNLTPTSSNGSLFLVKLNSNGNFIWAKQIDSNYPEPLKIYADNNSNVYVCAKYSGTLDVDPGSGVFNLTSTGSGASTFLEK